MARRRRSFVSSEVKGLSHIERALNEKIPLKARTKVIQRALKKSSRPMLKVARAKVKRRSGALAKSLRAWNEKQGNRRRYGGLVHIGPKRDLKSAISMLAAHYNRTFKISSVGIFHGHLVEFGAERVPRTPYLGPALASEGRGTIKRFGAIMADEIEKEATRQRRRQKK